MIGEKCMGITKRLFGKTADGAEVHVFTLENVNGITAEIINFGGILRSLLVPDRKGSFEDVVLGFDEISSYERKGPYFGALIGRHANRIENACFKLNGVEYKLNKNDGDNHLHGGIKGFDKVVWQAEIDVQDENEVLKLGYMSKDKEEGYPGNLKVQVTYKLTDNNELVIDYFAVGDQDTLVNLTNHSYFNLAGHSSGNILKHKLKLNADKITANDKYSIPTGEIREIKNSPMDFTELTVIGDEINSEYDQIVFGIGYDHNWILNTSGKYSEKAAEVYEENSGRVMEVFTTKPGIQFYSGNFLDGTDIGKGGVPYERRNGFCLETQYFPNGINNKNFPSPILKVGEEYKHTTVYKFSTR